ncbi:MAG TPA: hypothetical protein VGG85_19855 [Terracidiphilus sp.]
MNHNDQELPVSGVHTVNSPNAATRRSFLQSTVATIGGISIMSMNVEAAAQTKRTVTSAVSATYLDLLRMPDQVTAFGRFDRTLPSGRISLDQNGEKWVNKQIEVECKLEQGGLIMSLSAPSSPIAVIHARWRAAVRADLQVLGDAWERSYGELGWRNIVPERVMPWYFATHDGQICNGYGVKTDARSLCFWQLDADGVSLWLNVCNGGNGVELGERRLRMATVVSHRSAAGIDAFDSVRALCTSMCSRPSQKLSPVYGANDWNYSYGNSTAASILRDTESVAELSPRGGARPFSVIDGGWSNGTPAWPDMGILAAGIRQRSVRPGIWIRPLEAPAGTAQNLLLSDLRFGEKKERGRELAYDPTIPEALEQIVAKMRQAVEWTYEMIKHDFSTYDLLGQWGFEMGPQPTLPGWSFHDRSTTNAEVIAGLYAALRGAAGDQVFIDGCNTIGHLGQGIFDVQRSGDDTSGRQWERTRRMGVNTLAFRLPQHGTFFTLDPDLVGITDAVPWEFNRQWLEVLARTGVSTIVSVAPSKLGPDQRAAIRDAFQVVAAGDVSAKPLDWLETSVPQKWEAVSTASLAERQRQYDWIGNDGASPFLSP